MLCVDCDNQQLFQHGAVTLLSMLSCCIVNLCILSSYFCPYAHLVYLKVHVKCAHVSLDGDYFCYNTKTGWTMKGTSVDKTKT